MFFKAVLPAFTNFNKILQTEEPLIHCLHDQMQSFLHKLASKFVKHDVIQQTKQNDISLTKLDITLVNQKDDEDLTVGLLTTKKLNELLDEGDITDSDVNKFTMLLGPFTKRHTSIASNGCRQMIPCTKIPCLLISSSETCSNLTTLLISWLSSPNDFQVILRIHRNLTHWKRNI